MPKLIITFFIGLLVNGFALANEDKETTGPWDKSSASKNVGVLAERICGTFLDDGNLIAKSTKKIILDHINRHKGISSPSNGQITNFLNHNKNYMTCGREEKHYMKAAFDHGRAYDQLFNVLFFDELLTDDESLWIDINGISLDETGKPETVLDYMYKVQLKYTKGSAKRNEIKDLIETFEQYLGGKRFVDLPKAEQQKWLEYSRKQKAKSQKPKALNTMSAITLHFELIYPNAEHARLVFEAFSQ